MSTNYKPPAAADDRVPYAKPQPWGMSPDMVVLDALHPLLRDLPTPEAMLSAHVFASHRQSALQQVWVAGHLRVDHGQHALHDSATLLEQAQALAATLAQGPTFAQGMTKTMLQQEWAMTIEQAVEAEAQAQAICMQTGDFRRAYEAFAAKQKPVFEGN